MHERILTAEPARDRRTHARKSLRTPVAVAIDGTGILTGRSFDVSAVGLGMVLGSSLPKGSSCRLQFLLPLRGASPVTIQATATVAYCVLSQEHDGFKTGLQYLDIAPTDRAALDRFLR